MVPVIKRFENPLSLLQYYTEYIKYDIFMYLCTANCQMQLIVRSFMQSSLLYKKESLENLQNVLSIVIGVGWYVL